jgi:hypothetical protein
MKTIETAHDYFEQVVGYNLQQYKAQPTSLPLAYNLAISLFHMHDWVWVEHKATLQAHFDANVASKRGFNAHVQEACHSFKYIRDVANAYKHVSLSSASTSATHISNTAATGYGEGGYGVGGYGGGIIVVDGGTRINFLTAAGKVYEYWRDLLAKLKK